jgi:hypothetical protein
VVGTRVALEPDMSVSRFAGLVLSCALLACGSDGDPGGGTGGGGSSGSGAAGNGGSGGASGGSGGASGGGGGATGGSGGTGNTTAGDIGPNAAACALPAAGNDPVCEASAGADCWYIDAENGDDATGVGSFEQPWASFANVVSYYGTPGENGSTPAPANAIQLQAGDVVYVFGGTYANVYNYQGYEQVARFRGLNGESGQRIRVTAYPGEKPVIDAAGQGVGIVLTQSNHWEISGIEIVNGSHAGLVLEEADDVVVSHMHIHDTDGIDNDNIAGLYAVGATHVDIGCSSIHDNYDRENADTGGNATENSSNLVFFSGGDVRVHHSRVWQTPAPSAQKTGGCIKYKHSASVPEGKFEVDHNEISSCKFFAVGTGTQHSHVHHNLITNGETIVSRDFGGPTHQTDQVFEYNTMYLAGGLDMNPTDEWSDGSFDDPEGIVFSHNIVVHDLPDPSQERGTLVIGTYGSDALFEKTTAELTLESNCYFNQSGPPSFALFAANGGNYGTEGDQYSFVDWQALGYDAGSVNEDPLFTDAANGDFEPAPGSPCAAMGAYAP